MIIGLVREVKISEDRVGLTPDAVKAYVKAGHTVLVEKGAGKTSGFNDSLYVKKGAILIDEASDVWKQSEMIIKVKEPVKSEYGYFRKNLIIYTYLHLAAEAPLLKQLLKKKVSAIAYETIKDETGLPLLRPMSEVAGRLSVLEGARFLYKNNGGNGLLISGVTGVKPAKVTIIGAGVAGTAALINAYGLGSEVTILDINQDRLNSLLLKYPGIQVMLSNEDNIKLALKEADLIISSVLLPGKKTPKLIRKSYYKDMKKGAVIVDIAIDQGGSTDYSKPTYHDNPVFKVSGITHYCVANMPGIVPRTSTIALNNVTLKFGLEIANKGLTKALNESDAIKEGLNTYQGFVTNKDVAESFEVKYTPFESI